NGNPVDLDPGDHIRIYDGDDNYLGSAAVKPDGTWDFPLEGLSNGTHELEARLTDAAGNMGIAKTLNVTVFNFPLTINPLSENIETQDGFITNEATPEITGTIELGEGETFPAGAMVQVRLTRMLAMGGQEEPTDWLEATVNPDGKSWSLNLANIGYNFPLSEGDYLIEARTSSGLPDEDTVEGPVAEQDLQVIMTGPETTITIEAITDGEGNPVGDITNQDDLVIKGSIDEELEPGDKIEISTDGGNTWNEVPINPGEKTWEYQADDLPDGSTTIVVRVVDELGNEGENDSRKIEIDSTPPENIGVTIESITTDTGAQDFETSDTSLTINGKITRTLESDEIVQISIDDGENWKNVTMLEGGETWQYVDDRTLEAGNSYTYDVRVVDKAGNATPGTSKVVTIVDPEGSNRISITAITQDSGENTHDFLTNDNEPSISGTIGTQLNFDEKVQIRINGEDPWIEVNDVNGTDWSYPVSGALPEGQNTVEVRIVDSADNLIASDIQAVTIDTIPPAAAASIDSITDDTGLPGDFVTNKTSITIHGSIDEPLGAGEKVQISTDEGNTWIDVTMKPDGTSWSYHESGPLTEGDHPYQVRVVDQAGNSSATDSKIVQVDLTAPDASLSIDSISDDVGILDGFATKDSTPKINGHFEGTLQDDETIEISLDGGKTWLPTIVGGTTDSTWEYQVPDGDALGDGVYQIEVRAIDDAGNAGPTVSQNLTIDTTPPSGIISIESITADSGIAGDFITNDTTPTIHGKITATLSAGEKAQISLDGENWTDLVLKTDGKSWSYDVPEPFTGGDHTVYVRLIDPAGNVTEGEPKIITIDQTPPDESITVSIDSITDDAGENSEFVTEDRTPTIHGTFEGTLDTDDALEISMDGGSTWTKVSDVNSADGTWSHTVTENLPYDTHTIVVRVVDRAGNPGNDANKILTIIENTSTDIDTNTIAIDSIKADTGASDTDFLTKDTSFTIHGSLGEALAAGHQVQIRLQGSETWNTVTMDGDDAWFYNVSDLEEGHHFFVAQIVDANGDLVAQIDQEIRVDLTPPSATVTVTGFFDDVEGHAGDFDQTGTPTNDTMPLIKGSVEDLEAGDRVIVSVTDSLGNTKDLGEAVVTGNTWEYQLTGDQELAEDDYTFTA
ncbi:Ig-like domain-containing protein, partial [Desulfococcaceae bacterium OttesenSCG-928-F15]|nr:Ig-like domain-containing protein [Desulfococcaceae bacterium OttesenSCG-928-F15]